MDTTTYEDRAREIGTEHGRNAASWVELDEDTAQAIDRAGMGEIEWGAGPLSGEWADGYSVATLVADCGVLERGEASTDPEDGFLILPQDEYDGTVDTLANAYEDAYWQAFQAEVERNVETMRGPTLEIDEDAAYRVAGWPGVAVRYIGQTFGGRARVVMVGDDKVHEIDADDLQQIDEDAYCASCGQVGCTADGRDRGES